MGGDQDLNVPLHNGEQMYQAVKSLGLDTQLIIYPGQYHGLTAAERPAGPHEARSGMVRCASEREDEACQMKKRRRVERRRPVGTYFLIAS